MEDESSSGHVDLVMAGSTPDIVDVDSEVLPNAIPIVGERDEDTQLLPSDEVLVTISNASDDNSRIDLELDADEDVDLHVEDLKETTDLLFCTDYGGMADDPQILNSGAVNSTLPSADVMTATEAKLRFSDLNAKCVQLNDVLARLEMILNQSVGRIDDQLRAQGGFQKKNSMAISETQGVIQALVAEIGEERVQARMQELHLQYQARQHEHFGRDFPTQHNGRGKSFHAQQGAQRERVAWEQSSTGQYRERNAWDSGSSGQQREKGAWESVAVERDGADQWRRRGRGGRRNGGPAY